MDCHGPGTRLLVCIYLLLYVWIYVWLTYTFGYSHITGVFLDIGNQLGPNLHLTYGGKSDVFRYLPNLRDASDHFLSGLLPTFLVLPLSLASHIPCFSPLLPRDSNTNLLFAPLLQNPLTLNSGVYSKLCALLGAKDSVTAEQTTWNWMLGVPDLCRISGHPSWLIPPFTPQLWDRAALPSKWHGAPV